MHDDKAPILTIQEHGNHNLFTLACETRTEMVGYCQGGFEGGGCEFPGAHTFSELKCGLDLSDFRWSKAGHLQ